MMKLYYPKEDRDARLAYWAPRIGLRAAKSQVYSRVCSMATVWFAIAYFLVILVQDHTSREPAHALAYVALAGFLVAVAGTIILYVITFVSASRALGIRVTFRNYPPSEESAYRAWCRDRGLVPFTADS